MTIGYVRCSTEGQTDSGLGLDAQREAIRGIAEPERWYADEGMSGSRADRPGLLEAIESLGKGDTLVVAKRDRLARDVYLSAWIDKEVQRRGATIVSADGAGNGDRPEDALIRNIVAAFADYERLIIGARTKAALAAKRARGEKTGGARPYGYTIAEGGTLAPHPREQATITRMRDMRDAGHSLRAIASACALGHPERVRRILGRENPIAP